jgi:uncharacterized membrane protein/nitrite reductase/ring-hydroxylating ferredoxin subunit
MLKELLQGRPFRQPLHPMLVHLPLGLFTLSLLFDVAGFFTQHNWLVRGSFYCIATGIIMAILAAIPGITDYMDIREDHPAQRIAIAHMLLNLLAVGLYAINLGLRFGSRDFPNAPLLPFLLSLLALTILGFSGYLGGMLVYDDGIGVGRHRHPGSVPQETRIITANPNPTGELPVALATELPEGKTLRLNVKGTLIVLARAEGNVFAFQEFCSHQFGPLSEGRIFDHQIECPWHRSCFNIITGQVTRGPAETPLKTYATQIHDGRIFLLLPPVPDKSNAKDPEH